MPWSADNCDQNQGIIYKKSKVQLLNSSLVTNGGTSYYWSSGRYPVLYNVSFIVSANTNVPIYLFNVHAKAMSDETSYNKRKGASEGLKTLLDGASYNTKNIIVLGDFNDYLTGSQCTTKTDSPYKNFMDDTSNFAGLTNGLTDPNYGYKPVIDNIIISNELSSALVSGSIIRETAATKTISNYSNTTTDHTPVSAIFRFTIPTGIYNSVDNSEISVYPNPAQNYLTVKSNLEIENIRIFNLTGCEVLSSNVVNEKIDVSKLPQGIYIVRVKTDKGYYQQKLLKH